MGYHGSNRNLAEYVNSAPAGNTDPSGTIVNKIHVGLNPFAMDRNVCCVLERGWIIRERFKRDISCREGKSAADCCREWAAGWYQYESSYEGICYTRARPVLPGAVGTTGALKPGLAVTPGQAVAVGAAIVAETVIVTGILAPAESIHIEIPRIRMRRPPPCSPPPFPPAPEVHMVPGQHGCVLGHWHYYWYHQGPPPECRLRLTRNFGGCLDYFGNPMR